MKTDALTREMALGHGHTSIFFETIFLIGALQRNTHNKYEQISSVCSRAYPYFSVSDSTRKAALRGKGKGK